ncbi:MAG: hypothetical protein PVI13_13435 [Desulfobacterales bacterium]|jgi:hypothetical protein
MTDDRRQLTDDKPDATDQLPWPTPVVIWIAHDTNKPVSGTANHATSGHQTEAIDLSTIICPLISVFCLLFSALGCLDKESFTRIFTFLRKYREFFSNSVTGSVTPVC